jgi:aminopeptidase-like protein
MPEATPGRPTRRVAELRTGIDPSALGQQMYELCKDLYPICRSITGEGVRRTLEILGRYLPLERHEVASGTKVFDWTVPQEWNIRDAYLADASGHRVVDFQRCNLHVVGYSVPVRTRMSLTALRPHLYTLPHLPQWVPYRTSYYREEWGFCLSHEQLEALESGEYEVVIDSTLHDGALSYAECVIPGAREEEVLLSTHVCHPSLANDNLSGMALLTVLGSMLQGLRPRYTYRLLFIPGTIGSITWLARNEHQAGRIHHGLVVSGVGDPGCVSYKLSRRGDADVDRAARHVLATSGDDHRIIDFYPYGYDERQFCSPGFNLPVGRFGRTPHNEYPEYHTSADNLDLIRPDCMVDSLSKVLAIIEVLEGNARCQNLNPKGEPQLGRRGLYSSIGGQVDRQSLELALLWVLNLSDGDHDLLDIATRARLPFTAIRSAADVLVAHDLLEELPTG